MCVCVCMCRNFDIFNIAKVIYLLPEVRYLPEEFLVFYFHFLNGGISGFYTNACL